MGFNLDLPHLRRRWRDASGCVSRSHIPTIILVRLMRRHSSGGFLPLSIEGELFESLLAPDDESAVHIHNWSFAQLEAEITLAVEAVRIGKVVPAPRSLLDRLTKHVHTGEAAKIAIPAVVGPELADRDGVIVPEEYIVDVVIEKERRVRAHDYLVACGLVERATRDALTAGD